MNWNQVLVVDMFGRDIWPKAFLELGLSIFFRSELPHLGTKRPRFPVLIHVSLLGQEAVESVIATVTRQAIA
jgi:hypothetical protein